MKLKTSILIALMGTALIVKAQNIKTLKRLEAEKITSGNSLYIWKDADRGKTALRYYKNSSNNDDINLLNNDDVIGLTTSSKSININISFYNPLQYRVKISSTYVDDPFTKSYEQFLETFSKTFAEVAKPSEAVATQSTKEISTAQLVAAKTDATNISKITSSTNVALAGKKATTVSDAIKKIAVAYPVTVTVEGQPVLLTFKPKVKSILIKDWYYQLLKQPGFDEPLDSALTKNTQILEALLYFDINIDGDDKTMDEWVKSETENLYNANGYDVFAEELKTATKLLASLRKKYKETEAAKDELFKLINNPTKVKPDDGFQSYSDNTLSDIELKVNPLLKQRKDKLDEFEKFLNKLKSDFNDQFVNHKSKIKETVFGEMDHFIMKSNQDLNVNISFAKINIDGEEDVKDTTSVHFTIIKYTKGVVDFSTGFVFTNLSFPNYSIAKDAAGVMTIARELPTTKHILPTVFLNCYTQSPFSDMYLILPQLGVSTGKEFPSILLGVGLAIGNRFSLTGGGALAFIKDLNNYSVGNVVAKESDLENDLVYKTRYKGYISISYRIGKQ